MKKKTKKTTTKKTARAPRYGRIELDAGLRANGETVATARVEIVMRKVPREVAAQILDVAIASINARYGTAAPFIAGVNAGSAASGGGVAVDNAPPAAAPPSAPPVH